MMVSAAALALMVGAGRMASSDDAAVSAAPAALAGPVVSAPPTASTTVSVPSEGSGFVEVSAADGGSFTVASSIGADVQALLDVAAADGVVLSGWGLRSHQRQHELRRENGCPDGWTHSEGEDPSGWASASSCRVPTARPGWSNHETGKAIDFTYGGKVIGSRQSVPYRWLAANAARYGLKNLPSEPWHWSVDGR